MARKREWISDSALAAAHADGTPLYIVQQLQHRPLGTIGYHIVRDYWKLYADIADAGRAALRQAHRRVEQLPVDDTNSRLIRDMDLIVEVHYAGTLMVLHALLALQHLCDAIERATDGEWDGRGGIRERVDYAATALGLRKIRRESGYDGFNELLQVREAIEHPKPGNAYAPAEENWERVPMAWMLSERPFAAYDSYIRWRAVLESARARHADEHRTLGGTVTLRVERGIKSTRQARKPRSDRGDPER